MLPLAARTLDPRRPIPHHEIDCPFDLPRGASAVLDPTAPTPQPKPDVPPPPAATPAPGDPPAPVPPPLDQTGDADTQERIELPAWYPPWARALAERYYASTSCMFVLHGNVHDLCRAPDGKQTSDPVQETYIDLVDVLTTRIFGNWDLVLGYDLARGLRPLAITDPRKQAQMLKLAADLLGNPESWPKDPSAVLPLLDKLIEAILYAKHGLAGKRLCMVFEYAQHILPEGDLASLTPAQEAQLIRFLSWAQNPYIKLQNIAFCLIVDRLSELNSRLVQNAHVTSIPVPLPDRAERKRFCEWMNQDGSLATFSDFSIDQLADLTNGLNLYNLKVLLTQGRKLGQKLDADRFRELKKHRIEQQCHGLLEFVEPKYSLDMLVGQTEAKNRLREDAQLIAQGNLSAVPMGYLVCGPVGTGKSFLAECFAGSIGIPCVTLKNFRSKYVGETEGNLEQVLDVLRSLGPVVVVIDEADAALGTREAGGDAGTSSRVFAMIARQMGDTRYRGLILWMLLTSRPDLLPIDLKRQGRAEVHLPLFYPATAEEIREMLQVMARKNKVQLAPDALPEIKPDPAKHLSGSDLESILLAAQRKALTSGRQNVGRDDLDHALHRFLPSAQGLEKEMQEIAAVLECTDLEFLPDHWRKKVAGPDGRTRLQERLVAIRQLLREQ
jgi:AAA+ superfamily predicted ATPase